jgi:hypothetical protein
MRGVHPLATDKDGGHGGVEQENERGEMMREWVSGDERAKTTKGRHEMTLDEYMADDDEYRAVHIKAHEAAVLLEEAIGRIADLTADRDNWRDQCMDARKEWLAAIADRDNWKYRAETAAEALRNIEAVLRALARL